MFLFLKIIRFDVESRRSLNLLQIQTKMFHKIVNINIIGDMLPIPGNN